MLERQIVVGNRLGLHARAAARLVQTLARFQSAAVLARAGREVNAKSIMGVMLLAAPKGSTVTLRLSGVDEEEAMQAVLDLFESRFDEDA
ncbi:MAG TPA: HPr family phosphocarrier protein [Xanthomonadaceae bacterium]|nr:HPr family phosphocarrier protein [Xanthomonadaceae bacterium]